MQKHERYEELCALAILGELDRNEFDEFSDHAKTCALCEFALKEFSEIVQHLPLEKLPIATSREFASVHDSLSAQHFIDRAKGEGVVFSNEAVHAVQARRISHLFSFRRFLMPPRRLYLLFGALLFAVVAAIVWVPVRLSAPATKTTTMATVLSSSHDATAHAPEHVFPGAKYDASAERTDSTLRDLNAQVNTLRKALLDNQARSSTDEELLKGTLRKQDLEIANLSAKLAQADALIASSDQDLRSAQTDRDAVVADLVEQRQQRNAADDAVKLARSELEKEKQLNAAAHDVRELMGARRLHIVDVYDTDSLSTKPKSFGRVIYMEGKALIFYAFDLDQLRRGAKVTFQAWGEHDGEQARALNLGAFSLDDENQKRWVLKFSDPLKLRTVDTVFVTVESRNDPVQPSGRRYLQAYLGSPANHP